MKKLTHSIFWILMVLSITVQAQFAAGGGASQITGAGSYENDLRPIQTAVPFLGISPNARAASLGDQGVATSPDEFSAYWNPAKLARIYKDYGGAVSFNPWLRRLVNDMYLAQLTTFYKLRKEDAIGINFTYFDLGTINFTDANGQPIIDFNPREFQFSGTYSRQLSKTFSAGISLKYIYSNLAGNFTNSTGEQAKPGQSAAADIGLYYNNDLIIAQQDVNLAVGLSISNIGGKVTYTNNARADYLPTILRLGTAASIELDDFNTFVFGLEASKLLVPTPQFVSNTITGGNPQYFTPNYPIITGMTRSFYDAPFGGKEEWREIMLSGSVEYWYDKMFAVRAGYFHENRFKGNRQYFTLGLGVRYNTIGLDFSYLVPTEFQSPLANTVRFSICFLFNKPEKQSIESAIE